MARKRDDQYKTMQSDVKKISLKGLELSRHKNLGEDILRITTGLFGERKERRHG